MTPEEKREMVRRLLMQGVGPMSPMEAYGNAIRNEQRAAMVGTDGSVHPNRQAYVFGHPVATDPLNTLEGMSQGAGSALKQRRDAATDYGEARHAAMMNPATTPPKPGPQGPFVEPTNALESMSAPQELTAPGSGWGSVFSDLSGEQQQAIMALVQQGAPIDQAFEAVLGGLRSEMTP